MCGASQQQTDISNEQSAFYKQMTDQYATVFGENQNILGALTKTFTPILQAGPSQEGFSAGEKEALNTQAGEGTGADYAKAQTATSEALAARGGGDQFLPSGVDSQILAGNANAAAGEEASLKNQIVQNDYAQGYQNFSQATSALGGVASQYNPEGFAGVTTGAGTSAANTANQIASQDNSVWQGALGAVGAVGGAAAGGFGAGLAKQL